MNEKIMKMPSLQEQVYLYLKKAIVNGELEIGKVYSEQWAADLLGVSRTPVREAILQLRQEYLLEILPYKGFVVKPLARVEINETFQIRQALEGFCVILISQHCKKPQAQKLLNQLDHYLIEQETMAEKEEVYEFMKLDEIYHREIINYTDNDRLIAAYSEIRSRFERITVRVLKEPNRMSDTVKEHRIILGKMREGLPWEAYQAMESHLNKTKGIMEKKTAPVLPDLGMDSM